jgi:hypothetical protein
MRDLLAEDNTCVCPIAQVAAGRPDTISRTRRLATPRTLKKQKPHQHVRSTQEPDEPKIVLPVNFVIGVLVVLSFLWCASMASAVNLVSNPGFEEGPTSWLASDGGIITNDPAGAHTGNWYAWLGGYNNASFIVMQTITVPASASSVYGQFWWGCATQETTGNDWAALFVLDASGNIEIISYVTSSNATNTWQQSERYDLSRYKGQTIWIGGYAETDATGLTSFVFDDVIVEAVLGNWKVAAVADFNADGKPDILWRNTSTGTNAVWYMDGVTMAEVGYPTAVTDQNWKVAAVADFNADGKPDILWRNTSTGTNAVWYMDGVTMAGVGYPPAVTD